MGPYEFLQIGTASGRALRAPGFRLCQFMHTDPMLEAEQASCPERWAARLRHTYMLFYLYAPISLDADKLLIALYIDLGCLDG